MRQVRFDSVDRTNIAFRANQKQTKIPWDSQKRKPIETEFVQIYTNKIIWCIPTFVIFCTPVEFQFTKMQIFLSKCETRSSFEKDLLTIFTKMSTRKKDFCLFLVLCLRASVGVPLQG